MTIWPHDHTCYREDLNHNDFADDVAGAKKGMELHNEAKKKIHKIPVENIDAMGQRLLQRWLLSEATHYTSYLNIDTMDTTMDENEMISFIRLSHILWNVAWSR